MTQALSFLHDLTWDDVPAEVRARAHMCLLDTLGVGAGGAETALSRIIRDHAARHFSGPVPMAFDGRGASAPGAALALGMTIDALDAHDGCNPTKGHVGAGLIPGLLAISAEAGRLDGREVMADLVLGYELGCRAAMALHGTVSDYHTSGAWVAVAVAAVGARTLGLGAEATRHALGIAEYHGPRSQMMRVIDHPTMLKDGAGWGAMAGVSAAYLAQDGFTGAPAITVEDAGECFADLGTRWMLLEQYFKPVPVCRWAQGCVAGAMELVAEHDLKSGDIAGIGIETFHESTRLASARPRTTEEAQYSTSFPVAVAIVRGGISPADVAGDALTDPEILRLSAATVMTESDEANARFPASRPARVSLRLRDGRELKSDWCEPGWTVEAPASEADLRAKFHRFAGPGLGTARAGALERAVDGIVGDGAGPVLDVLAQPISSATRRGREA